MREFDFNESSDDEIIFRLAFELFIRHTFSSDEEVFQLYKIFAGQKGFLVRKDQSVKKEGKFMCRDFYCCRVGMPQSKISDPTKDARNRESSKCGCNAHSRVTYRKCSDIFSEECHVTKYVTTYTHDLYHLLKCDCFRQSGPSVTQIVRVIELENK